MKKKGTNTENVYELIQKRLKFIFDEFDNIYVSFSGGKDSGVLLNLCIDYIRKHNLNRKIGVFHMDYEAQYKMTTVMWKKHSAEFGYSGNLSCMRTIQSRYLCIHVPTVLASLG